MHHLVERPSENSYGKRFVIFQVVLPLQFFSIIRIMQILATLVREFVFLSARALNCPDFLFHIIIEVGPNFITVFISIRY